MSSRELALLLNQLKNKDIVLIRKDISAITQSLSKEGVVFLKSVEGQAKKNKCGTVILIGICL
jgi:hypothetical protein